MVTTSSPPYTLQTSKSKDAIDMLYMLTETYSATVFFSLPMLPPPPPLNLTELPCLV